MVGMKLNMIAVSLLLFFIATSKAQPGTGVYDITTYGGNEGSDIAQALSNAWKDSCAFENPNKVVIPKGTYKLSEVQFLGPCKGPVTVQVGGTIQAPETAGKLKGDGWVTFECVDQLTLSCQFHITVLGGKNITFQRFTVSTPETSPNTDGIHIGRSDDVNIVDSNIETGDDCISIGDGSKHITITNVKCGPGHDISIGCLGRYPNEEPEEGVIVKNCTITSTTNGVRIKTWPASPIGIASNMHFEDIVMVNVSNPVLIDQSYCPWNRCKAQVPSKIKISDVSFKNIRGSSATPETVKLICSKDVPCEGVEIADIDLNYEGDKGPAKSVCTNITPKMLGTLKPEVCSTSE